MISRLSLSKRVIVNTDRAVDVAHSFSRRLAPLPPIDPAKAPNVSAAITSPDPNRLRYVGHAHANGGKQTGWYSALATYTPSKSSVSLEVSFLSKGAEMPSFETVTEMHWDPSSSRVWLEKGDQTWYRDKAWVKNNQVPVVVPMSGHRTVAAKSQPDRLELTAVIKSQNGNKVTELIKLEAQPFMYHFCIRAVAAEIGDTVVTLARMLTERSSVSRKVQIAISQDDESAAMNESSVLCLMVTPSIWSVPSIVRDTKAAAAAGLTIILLSESDPRFSGYCDVKQVQVGAPAEVQGREVKPLYRRVHERSALLDHILWTAGFAEALPQLSQDSLAKRSTMNEQYMTKLEDWDETEEIRLLNEGKWRCSRSLPSLPLSLPYSLALALVYGRMGMVIELGMIEA